MEAVHLEIPAPSFQCDVAVVAELEPYLLFLGQLAMNPGIPEAGVGLIFPDMPSTEKPLQSIGTSGTLRIAAQKAQTVCTYLLLLIVMAPESPELVVVGQLELLVVRDFASEPLSMDVAAVELLGLVVVALEPLGPVVAAVERLWLVVAVVESPALVVLVV